MTEIKNNDPSIGQIKVQTGSSSNDGMWKYLLAANASGVGTFVGFIVGVLIGFGIGIYWHVGHVEKRQLKVNEVIQQNKELTKLNNTLNDRNDNLLYDELSHLGFSNEDIKIIYDEGKTSFIGKFKETVTEYLPGETIIIQPSKCETDYIGTEDANKVNDAIKRGVDSRARNAE